MTLQEIVTFVENLSEEERKTLLKILQQKQQQGENKLRAKEKKISKGDIFWEGIQCFRQKIEEEGIVYTEEDFANLRDLSPGREVEL